MVTKKKFNPEICDIKRKWCRV